MVALHSIQYIVRWLRFWSYLPSQSNLVSSTDATRRFDMESDMHASSFENMQSCYRRFIKGNLIGSAEEVLVLDVGGADAEGSYRDLFVGPLYWLGGVHGQPAAIG